MLRSSAFSGYNKKSVRKTTATHPHRHRGSPAACTQALPGLRRLIDTGERQIVRIRDARGGPVTSRGLPISALTTTPRSYQPVCRHRDHPCNSLTPSFTAKFPWTIVCRVYRLQSYDGMAVEVLGEPLLRCRLPSSLLKTAESGSWHMRSGN